MTTAITIDPVELVLRVAAKAKGASEVPPSSNAGPYVERVLGKCGLPRGNPWCAACVSDTGTIALEHLWPLPVTASCAEIARFAEAKGVLVATPERGDLWLLWDEKLGRFAHMGFVLSIAPDRQHIEVQAGNTVRPNTGGDVREGWLNWTRVEPIHPKDRFVRWRSLLP